MGLMDIINGMQNGPRGQPQPPSSTSGSSGGMSPMTMALIGVLAFKALKSLGGSSQPSAAPGGGVRPSSLPDATASPGSGGLGDILGGLLGGKPGSGGSLSDLLPGGAGNALNGGLGNLIKDLQNSGQGRVAQSWIGTGPNEEIAPHDLGKALGADTINALTKQTGLSRDELLEGLSQHLPQMIDQLTPDGRLPTAKEASRWM